MSEANNGKKAERNSERLRSYLTMGFGAFIVLVMAVMAALGYVSEGALKSVIMTVVGADALSGAGYSLSRGIRKHGQPPST